MSNIEQYLQKNHDRFESELMDILRIPSISSSPEHKEYMTEMAENLATEMRRIGLDHVEVMPTNGHPVVYGDWLHAGDKPTLLIYGHYDVQPVDPIDLWDSPPFEPAVKGNKVFARGSADDKGQLYMHVKAVEALLETKGSLPVNIKFILEGEEEVGSPNLNPFIEANLDRLNADYVVISDTPMYREGFPAITYGLRGLAYLQIDVKATDTDLHSGSFGGVTHNPINALVDILTQVKDKDGVIQVPGFYDDAVPISDDEHEKLGRLPFDEDAFAASIGAKKLVGEKGYTHLERLWARPTFDINGIWGGFQGVGAKTVIPAEAHAKVSMRLVPNQDPNDIAAKFQQYIASLVPDTVDVHVDAMHGGFGYLTSLDNPGLQAAVRAMEAAFDAPTDYIREGGSIPIAKKFADMLDAHTLLMGFGLPDQNAHAPNENFSLDNYRHGIHGLVLFYQEMAGI